MKKPLTIIIALGSVFIIAGISHALEKATHKAINKHIAEKNLNGFSLDSYLKDQLGFQDGIGNNYKNRTAQDWIGDGGEFEDEPAYLRSVNHFHNPLTKQGFNDLNHWWTLWGLFGLLNGQSSIQWSQNLPNTQWPGGYYSWHDAREYFYKALTSTDQGTRDQSFKDTFRGVGQLMHLVEDLAVPEHTRNTGHGPCWLSFNYECWVLAQITKDTLPSYPPIYFDSSAIGNPNPLAAVPVANLFDNNWYDGTNPNDTLRSDIGLSEYTNANFLCPGTMFTTPDFPYPNWNGIIQNPDPDPVTGKWYLTKLGMNDPAGSGGQIGNGEHINHLAVSRWGDKLLPSSIRQSGISLKMDKQVYADYAQKLIPRAVGYAAGLLNYFFRGQIDLSGWSSWSSTSVTFKIKNNTPNEAMGPGRLVVSYGYNNAYGVSNEVEMNETIAAGSESLNEYTVTFPQQILFSDGATFWFVFRGKLGNEDDAVAAKAIKGVSVTGDIGCLSSTCSGGPSACPYMLFLVPPITGDAGSFTTTAGTNLDLTFHSKIDCSYSVGYMSCDVSLYYQDPSWNNGNPSPCSTNHCEGPWDGKSFFSECTLLSNYLSFCYQNCDPNYGRRIWIRFYTY